MEIAGMTRQTASSPLSSGQTLYRWSTSYRKRYTWQKLQNSALRKCKLHAAKKKILCSKVKILCPENALLHSKTAVLLYTYRPEFCAQKMEILCSKHGNSAPRNRISPQCHPRSAILRLSMLNRAIPRYHAY